MSYTAGSVMDAAASLMNDTAKTLYTYAVQIPYLKMAQRDLQNDFILNEVPVALERSAAIDLVANGTSLTLPADFFLPIRLDERRDGSTSENDWVQMREFDFEKGGTPGLNLQVWAFREGAIQFVGATEAKEVKLTYWRLVPSASSEADVTVEDGAQIVLAYKTAALMSKYIGSNLQRATTLEADYGISLDTLIGIFVKNSQGRTVKRKPFRRGKK